MEESDHGWTLGALKEHFDERFREKDLRDQQRFEGQGVALAAARAADRELVAAALAAAEKAVQKAETASERRFEGVNEFRGVLTDQAARLATKDEVDTKINALSEKLVAMGTVQASQQGSRTGLNAGWGYLVGGIGVITGLVGGIAGVASLLAHSGAH